MSNSSSALYNAYKDAGFSIELFIPIAAKALIGLIGLFLNGALVFVTARCKQLHGRIHVLLALYAGAQMCGFELSQFVALYTSLVGVNFVSLADCFRVLAAPVLAFTASFVLQLAIAIDRFVCVSMPTRYNSVNSVAYLLALLAACALYACFELTIIVQNADSDLGETQLICQFSALYQRKGTLTTICHLSMEFASIALYAMIWRRMRNSPQASLPDSAGHRIFKSLLAIIAVEIFGWCCSAVAIFVLQALQVDDLLSFFIQAPATVMAVISSASSALILYSFSTDYRNAFQREFPLLKLLSKSEATIQVGPVPHQQKGTSRPLMSAAAITPIGNARP